MTYYIKKFHVFKSRMNKVVFSWPFTQLRREVVNISQFPTVPTIHLRRPWTRAFFRLASGTVGFCPRFKNSDHVITFLRRCGLAKHESRDVILVVPWSLKVDCLVVYHLPKNSGNFGWDVNGKTVLVCPNGNFPK